VRSVDPKSTPNEASIIRMPRWKARLVLWRHRLTHPSEWTIGLGWKPQDLWLGVFWKEHPWNTRVDIWICLVPMVPIHLTWIVPL
jgi:hypothetical protein